MRKVSMVLLVPLVSLFIGFSSYSATVTYYLAPISVFGLRGGEVSYVTPKQLTKGNKVDLAQSLSDQPGIYTFAKGPAAYDLVLNGLNRDNINVIVDGARIYGGCPSRMDSPIFHIPTNAVQVVKITYGPFDVTNEGSLGGLVKIETIAPKRGIHANIDLNTNSYGFFNPNVEASYYNGKVYFVGGYSYQTALPYKDANGKRITDLVNYKNPPKRAYYMYSAFGKIGYTPTLNTNIYLSYLKKNSNDVLYPFLGMDAIYDRTNIVTLHISKVRVSPVVNNLRFKVYYSDVYHKMTNQFRKAPMFSSVYAATHTYGGSFSMNINGITFGTDAFLRKWFVEKTNMNKAKFMIPDVKLVNQGFYVKKKFELEKRFLIEMGARIDYTASRPSKGLQDDNERTFPQFLVLYKKFYNTTPKRDRYNFYPSGYVNFSYTFGNRNKVYFGFGHSARIPDPEERYIFLLKPTGVWLGNPNLNTVKNNEFDFGFSGSFGKLRVKVNNFYRYINDYITLTKVKESGKVYVLYENTDAYMYGSDAKVEYDILDSLRLTSTTSCVFGHQNTNSKKYIRSSNIPDLVPLRERIALKYHKSRYSFVVDSILSARQTRVNSDVGEKRTPGYGVVDMRASYNYRGFHMEAGIDNIFNKEYYSYTDYYSNPFNTGIKLPEPGRTYYLNVAYRF